MSKKPKRARARKRGHRAGPPALQSKQEVLVSAVMREMSFSGPLPLPAHLKAYDDAFPGAGERIIKMAEATFDFTRLQIGHRHSAENRVIDNNIKAANRGQWLAFAVIIAGFVTVVVLAVLDVGGAAIGVCFGALMGAAVYVTVDGRKRQASELDRKRAADKDQSEE